MEPELRNQIADLFDASSRELKSLGRRKRSSLSQVEVVFLDVVNNKPKQRRALDFADVLTAMEDGSQPIGLLLIGWHADDLEMKQLKVLSPAEEEALTAAFAEAQDEQRQFEDEDGD